ncbi:hypothetical protein AZI86_04345 [Bdellovibrio bacteriovorus]|uniref:Uncharacterized protein n=1 Tax=Bdellovibrio bacteriovorus TaxID=959 RepID=A0A150WP79_BDEBC|nr:hypothetical protein [Bdellovibrio bacteriovorus]KYG66292.1 hypothetical protein AZI86_04345 [Bdellovibrio bacteriovorus]
MKKPETKHNLCILNSGMKLTNSSLTNTRSSRLFASLAVCLTLFATACSENGHTPAALTAPATPAPMADGSSSGGGSFGDESSLALLKRAVAELQQEVKFINSKSLPAQFDKEKFLSLLKNLSLEPNNTTSRYDRELMFDYENKDGAQKIKVLSLFFKSHAAIPVNTLGKVKVTPYVDEIKLKLVHEAAHVFGIGLTEETDKDARAFSQKFIEAKEFNNFFCLIGDPDNKFPYENSKGSWYEELKTNVTLALNRATGAGNIGSDSNLALDLFGAFLNPPELKGRWNVRSFAMPADKREAYSMPLPSRNEAFGGIVAMDWTPQQQSDSEIIYSYTGRRFMYLEAGEGLGPISEKLVLTKKEDLKWEGFGSWIDKLGEPITFKIECREQL